MANSDKPHGFDPFGSIKQVNPYKTATAAAVFRGDVRAAANTGYVGAAVAGNTQLSGVSVVYMPAASIVATGTDILLYDDPDQMFYAQTVTETAPTRTIINSFCDHVVGTGNTNTFLSGHELDISVTDTTVSYGWRLLDFLDREDNDTTVEHAEMICVMNEAARHTITAGV